MSLFITEYGAAFVALFIEMSPYLLLGLFFAGLLHVYFPKDKVNRYLGQNNFSSVVNAALIGIPLPLCSCGVIPTGVSFYKNGASKGPTVSFLISTPQTGVDSILATYALLGLPFALIRPVVAFVTGIVGGWLTNQADHAPLQAEAAGQACDTDISQQPKWLKMLRYAFVDFLDDIARWLVLGLVLAALIDVLVPEAFFESYLDNSFLSMLVMLGVSVPLYVCATGSIPIAAVLMAKGLSPGAALVFLMAGPATNAATMTVVGKALGKKTLAIYMASIMGGALFFGWLVNTWLPASWFALGHLHGDGHAHEILPLWLQWLSAAALGAMLAFSLFKKWMPKLGDRSNQTPHLHQHQHPIDMNTVTVKVSGMTCNHCKMSVEKNVGKIAGIENVSVDLATKEVTLAGQQINLDQVKATVEDIGFEYGGVVKAV